MIRYCIVPAVLLVSASLGIAQVTGQAASGTPKPAPNAWMLIPTPVSASDNVPASLRYARDQHYDGIANGGWLTGQPLTPESAAGIHIGGWAMDTRGPEIPNEPNRAVIIGKFTSSRSVLSASRHSIYTEITVHVTDVFEDVAGHASPGSDITICYMGGTIKTDSGQVISLLTDPQKYSLQPGHTYLLVLRHYPDEDRYSAQADWDLSDGIVRGNSETSIARQKQGRSSSLIGLTMDQLRSALRQRFQVK